ncbi:MAG: hypothetical protein ACR2PX_16175 [Endozoicomonas sp.]
MQFFTNGEVTTYLDQYARTYLEEQRQLFNQGFLTVGDIIETHDINEAFDLHKKNYGSDVKAYSTLSLLAGLTAAL